MGVLVWKSHWQVKDLQVSDTSLSSFEFCDCDVCVCVSRMRPEKKVCRAGCRRTTEAGAGPSLGAGASLWLTAGSASARATSQGAPPSEAHSEDPDGRTGGALPAAPSQFPAWETCSDSPASLEAWVFPKG